MERCLIHRISVEDAERKKRSLEEQTFAAIRNKDANLEYSLDENIYIYNHLLSEYIIVNGSDGTYLCGNFGSSPPKKMQYNHLSLIDSSSKKSKGCFITTAACEYRGYMDNCHELNVLRDFRDNYLLKTKDGQDMVDYYYAISPKIIEHLSNPSDFEKVWNTITDCVKAIELGKHQRAISLYKDMTLSLKDRFINNGR